MVWLAVDKKRRLLFRWLSAKANTKVAKLALFAVKEKNESLF